MFKKKFTLRQMDSLTGYGFLAIWIIGFIAFTAYPFFYSIYLSFHEIRIGARGIEAIWNGLGWYQHALFVDIEFIPAIINTFQFIIFSFPVIIVAALIIAVLLNGKFFARGFFRALFFFPVIIISGPVIAELIDNDAANIGNMALSPLYIFVETLPGLISTPILYVLSNTVLILWFSGVQILIYLAGLQKIGSPIYEAAAIDGASQWEIFWKIVLPFIRPLILVNAIYTVVEIAAFPNNQINQLIVNRMHTAAVIYSYSAALSWMYFLIQAALLAVVFFILRPKGD